MKFGQREQRSAHHKSLNCFRQKTENYNFISIPTFVVVHQMTSKIDAIDTTVFNYSIT